MEQDMSEKSSTPDVPAEDVAAAQRAADAGGVTAELGEPVVVATPDLVTPTVVAPAVPSAVAPIPSAAPAGYGTGAGSPAQKAGLAVGAVITAVNGTTISNVSGLMQVLDPLAPGSTLKLMVSRSG